MRERANRRQSPTATTSGEKKASSGLFIRGEKGRANTQHEIDEAAKRREIASKGKGPLRFFVPVGEEKQIIILDDAPDFFIYEHNIKHPETGKWGYVIPCIKTQDNCPICEHIQESSYVLYLSVIDLTPFKDRNGVEHSFSRKLMPVKYAQQAKFNRRYEKEGTLRGAVYTCTRLRKTDAAIGSDIEFEEMASEEELANDYIREWVDNDGKKHTENEGFPIDYESIVEVPTMDFLLQLTGADPTPGSKQEYTRNMRTGGSDQESSSDDGWEEEDNSVWDEDHPDSADKKDTGSRRGSRAGRSSQEATDSDSRASRSASRRRRV